MNRPLLAIPTCNIPKFQERARAQRETWVPDANRFADVQYFVGHGVFYSGSDQVQLDVDDGYAALPSKVKAICNYALNKQYEYLFKTDDDTYINPWRLFQGCQVEPYDYVGHVRSARGGYPAPYASGYGYWLSRKAIEVIAAAPLSDDPNEDRWVGNTLAAAGIFPASDTWNYRIVFPLMDPALIWWPPSGGQGGSVIGHTAVLGEFPPDKLRQCHVNFSKLYKNIYCKYVRVPTVKLIAPGDVTT